MTRVTSTPKPKYTIEIDHDAQKILRRQGRTTRDRLIKAIFALADNPQPSSSRKLEGYKNLFRLRVGDWRIVYQINDNQLLVVVLEVGARGDIYRGY